MAKVDIPYYIIVKGRGYWRTTPTMRAAGFSTMRCGKDGSAAWKIAEEWNVRWQAHRAGSPHPGPIGPVDPSKPPVEALEAAQNYPAGSLGEAFARYRHTEEWRRKAPRTREDWWRGWKRIRPTFGDIAPTSIDLEDISAWRATIERLHGRREAHRAQKIWRALWKVTAALKYCGRDDDPSLGVRNSAAKGRSETWTEGEVVRLVKRAWRENLRGLAVAMAIAWDSQLSPVDVRAITAGALRRRRDTAYLTERGKSGQPAGGLLSRRTMALVDAYRAGLGFELHDAMPLLRTRGLEQTTAKGGRPRRGAPFTKNSLGEEFRIVRGMEFGPREKRQLQDFRRSGAVEAIAGGAKAEDLANGMGNTLGASNTLYETYVPVDIAMLQTVRDQRRKGRAKMRERG